MKFAKILEPCIMPDYHKCSYFCVRYMVEKIVRVIMTSGSVFDIFIICMVCLYEACRSGIGFRTVVSTLG